MPHSNTLSSFLSNYVSEHKQQRIKEVLSNRTRHIAVVLENIYHPHNASAVVRSCDGFGIQDVHVIEGHNEYEINPYVVRGASKWVSVYKHKQTPQEPNCFTALKNKGYRLVGTSPHSNSTPIDALDITTKTALVFGTEETGLSNLALNYMDELVHIPMYGFTESFNISASAAVCLHSVTSILKKQNVNWHLSESEKNELTLEWFKKIVPRADVLEREFAKLNQNKE